jgi:hypothetical protein
VPKEREERSEISRREKEREKRSVVSAKTVPLPISVVSRSRAGYAGSVAPSDSISSVGSKKERERLRSRW